MSSSSDAKTVVITGATGRVGKAAVRESLALGLNVRAFVHAIDERSRALADQGAEVIAGDLLDPGSFRPAMEGADAALMLWRIQPGIIHATANFAQVAKETGVRTVLNLSQRNAYRESPSDMSRDSYIAGEVLKWSGLDVIDLRPTMFLEWFTYPWMLPYLRKGVLRMPAGEGRSAPVAAADQGRAIAALLLRPEKHVGTTIPLSGPIEMSHEKMAAELSAALGRTIVYENPPVDEYVASLREMGVPPYLVQAVGGIMRDYQAGRLGGLDDNIELLTGRRSMTVGEYARAHADLLNGA
jgi:NAD(P)H dehydrogenase (quinone)